MRQFKITQRTTYKDSESFSRYLKEVSDIKQFETPLEEYICAKKAYEGDSKSVDELVRRNLRFVISVAKQYVTDDMPINDLVNEGNIGLLIAARKNKPELGNKFISYAVWWIRKIILEHVNKTSKMVRLPANKISDIAKLNKQIADLEQKNCNKVDLLEVIDTYGHELVDGEFLFLDVLGSYSMDSLDRQLGEDGDASYLGDLLCNEDDDSTDHLVNNFDVVTEINNSLDILKPRDKEIMELLFGLNGKTPMNLIEVGNEIGISREMVRQIREKSLKKLRNNPSIKNVFHEHM
jgi:RNA polymerase primary sigma factor